MDQLRPPRGSKKRRKRVGCGIGSGHGKTAGRGTKGQKARSGGKIPAWFEGGQMPIQRRIPKRGFTNPFKKVYQIVNVGDLDRFEAGSVVNRDALKGAGLIKKITVPVKMLGGGDLTKPLKVQVDSLSAMAREKILSQGGAVEVTRDAPKHTEHI